MYAHHGSHGSSSQRALLLSEAMSADQEQATERSRLLSYSANGRRLSAIQHDGDAESIISTSVSKEEQALSGTAVGERLAYNDYTTIDWLHDLV